MQIGPYRIDPPLALAPMAGVTDKPFRLLCRQMGAGLAVSEMTTADPHLWHTRKSRLRMDHAGEPAPISVQIAGADPYRLAEAARHNVDHGAQIIDINMGCPAKKVCNAWAGSALMQDEALVGRILDAVTAAVSVPVTLKMRTGWSREHRNALRIAAIAEQCGIAALAVHGRTRDQLYTGQAEYDTVTAIKAAVTIPVMVNGDIDCAAKARAILRATGCDGVMIGRAAQGRPWIFRQIAAGLGTHPTDLPDPSLDERCTIIADHVRALHRFYGQPAGVRIARKHVGWFVKSLHLPAAAQARAMLADFNHCETPDRQLALLRSLREQWMLRPGRPQDSPQEVNAA